MSHKGLGNGMVVESVNFKQFSRHEYANKFFQVRVSETLASSQVFIALHRVLVLTTI